MQVSIDIADAVQEALNERGTSACARPLPHDMTSRLPITLVEPLGGGERFSVVLDRMPIRMTTWAPTPARAVEEAALAYARLASCVGQSIGGVPCYRVSNTTEPYEAPDPAHPDIPRVIQTAHLWVRTKTID